MHADATPRVPGYANAALLHVGSRSAAYRARRIGDDQPVILKVAKPGAVAREEGRARLRHELGVRSAIPRTA